MWLKIAYFRYTMGQFDPALIIYSFLALNGHAVGAREAEFMWRNNLTTNLTCKFGHHLLCASYYDIVISLIAYKIVDTSDLKNKLKPFSSLEYLVKAGHTISEILPNSSFPIVTFELLTPMSSEAKFRYAEFLFNSNSTNGSEFNINKSNKTAENLLDEIIYDCTKYSKKCENLMPAVLSRAYHYIKSFV